MPAEFRSDLAPETPTSRARRTGSPSDHLRVAIVGSGRMGQHHARAIRRLASLAKVVATADPSSGAREAMRLIWPESAGFSSLEELLNAVEVDVVHICTAPETHEQLAELSLESGRHTYVEKPAAESAEKAERLLKIAKERQVLLCPGHQLLFESPMRQMRDLLPCLGSLIHVESFLSFCLLRGTTSGGGALPADLQLVDVLPHPVYLLLHVLELAEPDGQVELAALELGRSGTAHAIVRRGKLSGTLIVTVEGRPIENYLRVVGTNGTLHADFVRGTVQRLIGPGQSGIDKVLTPFRLGRQLVFGTSAALGERALKRQRSYPGLAEIFQAFYTAIRTGSASPVSAANIIDTARIWERIASELRRHGAPPRSSPVATPPCVLVTGGTGFLGRAVVRSLTDGSRRVRAVARRVPAPWERQPGVEYVTADLGMPLSASVFEGVDVVVHCAAETAGGWEEHQRNSLAATENVFRGAASAAVRRLIHVSSLATLAASRNGEQLREDSPLEPYPAGYGPYVWGKVESERLAERLGAELGIDVRIIRPGALVDYERFDPPGALGRRLGNIFVAVGKPSHPLPVVDVRFAGETVAWIVDNFASAPRVLNLIPPTPPSRRDLVARLRRTNPDLRVAWLPPLVLAPLSGFAVMLQKILRPKKPAVSVAKVFAQRWYDASEISKVASSLERSAGADEALTRAGRTTKTISPSQTVSEVSVK